MDASAVARLMGDLLEAGELGENENFFASGGNSLLALTLVAEVSDRSGVSISLLEFFRHPTPKEVSGLINERQGTE